MYYVNTFHVTVCMVALVFTVQHYIILIKIVLLFSLTLKQIVVLDKTAYKHYSHYSVHLNMYEHDKNCVKYP